MNNKQINKNNPIIINLENEEEEEEEEIPFEKQKLDDIIKKMNKENGNEERKRTKDAEFFEKEYKKKIMRKNPLTEKEEEKEYRERTNNAIDNLTRQFRKIDTRLGIVENKIKIIEEKIEPEKYKGNFEKVFHRM